MTPHYGRTFVYVALTWPFPSDTTPRAPHPYIAFISLVY